MKVKSKDKFLFSTIQKCDALMKKSLDIFWKILQNKLYDELISYLYYRYFIKPIILNDSISCILLV
jgi:hypothetical protein